MILSRRIKTILKEVHKEILYYNKYLQIFGLVCFMTILWNFCWISQTKPTKRRIPSYKFEGAHFERTLKINAMYRTKRLWVFSEDNFYKELNDDALLKACDTDANLLCAMYAPLKSENVDHVAGFVWYYQLALFFGFDDIVSPSVLKVKDGEIGRLSMWNKHVCTLHEGIREGKCNNTGSYFGHPLSLIEFLSSDEINSKYKLELSRIALLDFLCQTHDRFNTGVGEEYSKTRKKQSIMNVNFDSKLKKVLVVDNPCFVKTKVNEIFSNCIHQEYDAFDCILDMELLRGVNKNSSKKEDEFMKKIGHKDFLKDFLTQMITAEPLLKTYFKKETYDFIKVLQIRSIVLRAYLEAVQDEDLHGLVSTIMDQKTNFAEVNLKKEPMKM